MREQTLLHNENNYYLCVPLYNAGNGKLFAGRRVIISQKITPSEAAEATMPSTNLCNVQTSKFLYTPPVFGFQGTAASHYDARNKDVVDVQDHNKEKSEQAKNFFRLPTVVNDVKVVPAEKLNWKFPRFASIPGVIALTSANTMIDMSAGHSFSKSAIAEIIGSAVNIVTTSTVRSILTLIIKKASMGVVGAGIAGAGLSTGVFIAALVIGYKLSDKIVNDILNDKDGWDWNAQ